MKDTSRILTIVGMHRSGTSLAAQYLNESGLFLGKELLGKNWSNPGGHFEDKEFIEFHNIILRAHKVNYAISSPIECSIDDLIIARARKLLEDRKILTQWGWKDPRTTLFIPLWKKLIPDCHFVIVYRHYLPVIRSLISRDYHVYLRTTSRWERMMKSRFSTEHIAGLTEKYLRMWILYNKEIIKHLLEDPHVIKHVVTYDQLVNGDYTILKNLQNHGFELSLPIHFNTNPKRAPSLKNIPSPENSTLLLVADEMDKLILSGIH